MSLLMLVSTRLPTHVHEPLAALAPDLTLVPYDADSWPANASQATSLLTWNLTIEELDLAVQRAPITWIQSDYAGMNKVLIPSVLARPITICNASGAHAPPIAEWVIMLILAFSKGLPTLLDLKARKIWQEHISQEIGGKTVGIVGAGQIGRTVARLSRALGMRVIAMRRRPIAIDEADEVVTPDQVGDLCARADFLVVTAPLTPETEGMVNAAAIARLRPTAVVINVGRGPVIDEIALTEALAARRIAGYGVDVFGTEPLPPDSPFWTLDNVILSPHCCDHTPHTDARVVDIIIDNIRRYLTNQPLRNIVDKQAGY